MMNPSTNGTASHSSRSLDLLNQLSVGQFDVCLKVYDGSVNWFIYCQKGKLIYATNSVDPLERLERHLRRLCTEIPGLNRQGIRASVQQNFDFTATEDGEVAKDYQAICWLLEKREINEYEARKLVTRLTKEVLKNYIVLTKIDKHVVEEQNNLPASMCQLEISNLVEDCYQELREMKILGLPIWSYYQRPYFFGNSYSKQLLSEEKQQKLGSLLRGFNFHQLAAILNQDELDVLKKLRPLIVNGAILVREPQPPFDLLPKIDYQSLGELITSTTDSDEATIKESSELDIANENFISRSYKIACIDDSTTILNEIKRCLENDSFSVHPIKDSVRALMQIIRIKPDLILLDVGMPNVDGYQLCSLIRNNPQFKKTPIVMVTGNTGLIDRAKAKLAGANDYMTKPFTQTELLKIVFRHLT